MKRKLLAILAAGLMGSSMAAHAVPVDYNVAFDATTGPSGVGSLSWDADLGVLSHFTWNFGGTYFGGLATFGADPLYGGTTGQFVFEILSQTDVHPGADCIAGGGCSVAKLIDYGTGPLGALGISLSGGNGFGASYIFNSEQFLGTGKISLTAAVPEPGTLALLVAGLAGIGALRRRLSN